MDDLLYKAMRSKGIDLKGDAIRLCLAYACGDLDSICVVVNDLFINGQKNQREFYKSLVAVRKIELPKEPVVWLEDATGDCQVLASLLDRPIMDCTPNGRLEFVVPPLQYADSDVTQQTSPNLVRGLVRGVLSQHPTAQQVGIITHREHLSSLKLLESLWLDRIAKTDYFHSGNDRTSNKWLLCDLIIILGTPRVPPSAVREGLIQIGQVNDAVLDGDWGLVNWKGKTMEGDLLTVSGRGYRNPFWNKVHQMLVKNALLQAVGRGRGVRNGGVPVVVVSNELLDLPLLAFTAPIIKDEVTKTFLAIQELILKNATIYNVGKMSVSISTEDAAVVTHASKQQTRRDCGELEELTLKNPTIYNVGKMSVSITTEEAAVVTCASNQQTRRHCGELQTLGLLARKGERGGWMLTKSCIPLDASPTSSSILGKGE